MSDINITLDSTSAITNAKRLEDALDRLENKAISVKSKVAKFLLTGNVTLKTKRLVTDMKAIQAAITARPLFAKVRLSVDKRTLPTAKGWKDPMFSGGTLMHPGKGAEIDKKTIGSLKTEDVLTKSIAKTRALSHKKTEFSQLRRLSKARTMQKIDIEGAKKRVAANIVNTQHLDYFRKSQAASLAREIKRRQVVKTTYNTERAMAMLREKGMAKMFQGLKLRESMAKKDPRWGDEVGYVPPTRKVPLRAQADLTASEDIQRRLTERQKLMRRDVKTIDIEKDYRKIGKSIGYLNAELLNGEITQKKYNKRIAGFEKNMKGIDKQVKKTSKTIRASRGFFMNFTMALTAIAATMFIWQKLKQLMIKILTIGDKLSQTFAKMRVETGMLNSDTSGLVSEFSKLSSGTIWGIPKIYEAYKILRKEGLGANEAIKQIIPTLKIAQNEDMKLADAAKMAAHNTFGLREQYLQLDKEIQKTGRGAWDKLKKSIRNVFEAAYMKQEPRIIKALNELNNFISDNQESIIAGLSAIATATRKISEWFIWGAAAIAKFIGAFTKIEKIGIAKLKNDLDIAIKAWHDYYKELEKVKAKPDFFVGISQAKEKQEAIDRITAAMNRLKNTIADLQKQIDKLPETEKGKLPTLEEWTTGYEQIYKKLGMMANKHYEQRSIESEAFAQKQVDMFKDYGTIGEYELTKLAKQFDAYNLKWEQNSKFMKDNVELFKLSGKMSDMYYNMLIDKIKEATKFYIGLNAEQKKELEMLKKRVEFNKRQAALRKPHEAVFESTGMMTSFLKQERIRMAEESAQTKAERMPDTEASRMAIAKSLTVDLLKIDTDFYAKSLENQSIYFDTTGKIRQEYIDLQTGEYKRAMDTMIAQGMDPKLAEKSYKEMVATLWDKLLNPMQESWQKYHNAIGIMSQNHFALERRSLIRQYEYMKSILGNRLEVEQWFSKQLNLLRAKELEGHENVTHGILAAWIRLTEDVEPLSKMVSDSFIKGAHDIERAWKETFFDTINGEWDNFRDHAINILTAVRDTANEIAYDILKAWSKPLLKGFIGGIIGSSPGASTGGTSSSASTPVLYTHRGGKIGYDVLPTKMMPTSLFTHAPKLHQGLAPDEYPAILQKGEEVIEKGATRGDTYVTIHANDSKSFVDIMSREPQAVLGVVNKALAKNPTGRHKLKRMVS